MADIDVLVISAQLSAILLAALVLLATQHARDKERGLGERGLRPSSVGVWGVSVAFQLSLVSAGLDLLSQAGLAENALGTLAALGLGITLLASSVTGLTIAALFTRRL